ncbi:MAG: acyl-CoA thioesterase [Myxococcaceae bacterium]
MSYPVTVEFPIHWGEMDALGHVNNAHFFTWFESSRMAFFQAAGIALSRQDAVAPILAAAHCDYLEPVVFPARVVVGARATKLGNTSLTLEHAVWRLGAPERLLARGSSVVVLLNYATGEKVRIPEAARAAIAALKAPS